MKRETKGKTMQLTIDVTEQMLKDLLITAVEGGSNYWAAFRAYDHVRGYVEVFDREANEALWAKYRESDDDEVVEEMAPHWKPVNVARLLAGLALLARSTMPKRHLAAVLSGNADAENADVVLQFAVLGECVYG